MQSTLRSSGLSYSLGCHYALKQQACQGHQGDARLPDVAFFVTFVRNIVTQHDDNLEG